MERFFRVHKKANEVYVLNRRLMSYFIENY